MSDGGRCFGVKGHLGGQRARPPSPLTHAPRNPQGTLCIMGQKAGHFDASRAQVLANLAEMMVSHDCVEGRGETVLSGQNRCMRLLSWSRLYERAHTPHHPAPPCPYRPDYVICRSASLRSAGRASWRPAATSRARCGCCGPWRRTTPPTWCVRGGKFTWGLGVNFTGRLCRGVDF
jgi:hypothetical protein